MIHIVNNRTIYINMNDDKHNEFCSQNIKIGDKHEHKTA